MTIRTPRLLIATTLFGAMLLALGCSPPSVTTGPSAPAGWASYGDSVTLADRTPIQEILSQTEAYVGKTVAVEGRVSNVCTMMGCWIEIQDENSSRLRLKVEDGVIVFPQDAIGKRAVLQGKVEKLTFTREEFEAKAKHEAEERGSEFNPDSIQPPYEEIRLWGSGALIEETA